MDSYLDYFIAVTPIIISHIAVPPLSYFDGERAVHEWLDTLLESIYSRFPQFHKEFVSSMIRDAHAGLDSTVISHLFVHGSFSHLFGNLFAAVQFGYTTYLEFGAVGLYTVFIFGGATASLPTFLYNDQRRAIRNLVYEKIAILPDSGLRRMSGECDDCQ